jgi:hypothetical protein
MSGPNPHETFVADWVERVARDLTTAQYLQLFERALDALWQRSHRTLGDVTLTAIIERVLATARERFPWVSWIDVSPAGVRFHGVQERASVLGAAEVADGMRFVLGEFLTLLGSLTAEILTPALQVALSAVSPEEAREVGRSRNRHNTTGEEPR